MIPTRSARLPRVFAWFLLSALLAAASRAEDGYRLWLRYDRIGDTPLRQAYAAELGSIALVAPTQGWGAATVNATRDELVTGLEGLLGTTVPVQTGDKPAGTLLVGTSANAAIRALVTESDFRAAGEEGYVLREVNRNGRRGVVLAANRDIGLLYGAFALLRHLQLHRPLAGLNEVSAPRIQRRLLNHWDNLNGFVERGYAGRSIWNWFELPDYVSPRYRDYARANASIGINGTVLNNVNADPLILTAPYLEKVAVIAKVLRPYGIRVYLAVRFSAPVEIGGLRTADPREPAVQQWWRAKADEIYAAIPDFGGFLVKANSEGQPGPQTYGRSHAEGANLLADALAPHGGVVIWRAFVYDNKVPDDRAKQAFNEFVPLDGQFHENVIIQVKNGPIDFMPREPFHPLFGAMPHTPLAAEFQITQEYLGTSLEVAFLAPMWKECLESDTFRPGPGATVARVVDGSVDHHGISMIAGVSNVGSDRNWTGHPLGAANWYAFGRLAWDHELSSATIADEWTRQTFSNDPAVVQPITSILLASREAVVDYSMPLGLHHIMAEGHHFGPGPWVDGLARKDWTAVYYHQADTKGIGFDRTATGSNALSQYAPPVAERWANLATCPDKLLLWFHHLPWEYRMRSGRTLWDELCLHYQHGVDEVRQFQREWATVDDHIDHERFEHVRALLTRQERDARIWRDACTQYFQTFSQRPLPASVEPPEHPLAYYERMKLHYVPGSAEAR